jgi:hypothetical protein
MSLLHLLLPNAITLEEIGCTSAIWTWLASSEVPVVFIQIWNFLADFNKRLQFQISLKSSQWKPFDNADRRTDKAKLQVFFCNYANPPNNGPYYSILQAEPRVLGALYWRRSQVGMRGNTDSNPSSMYMYFFPPLLHEFCYLPPFPPPQFSRWCCMIRYDCIFFICNLVETRWQ